LNHTLKVILEDRTFKHIILPLYTLLYKYHYVFYQVITEL